MNAMSNNVRHAVSKQSGATTLAFRSGRGEWEVRCLSHSTKTTVASRGVAWTTSSHPATFCGKCKLIAAGKGKRIEGKRLDMPAITAPATNPKTTTKASPTTARTKAAKPATAKDEAA